MNDDNTPQPENIKFRATVLVVEDNPINQKLILAHLTKMGCEAQVASHGKEALEAVQAREFDLIFMDCQMPEMDGYEATQKIREVEAQKNIRQPVIAITANSMTTDHEKCIAAGMNDYLIKPFTREELFALLQRWIPENRQYVGTDNVEENHAPSINMEKLNEIKELDDSGSNIIFSQIVNSYIEHAPQQITSIKTAFEAGDLEIMAAEAHSLKSSSSSLGAIMLTDLCETLEKQGRFLKPEDASGLIQDLESEYAKFDAFLKNQMGGDV